MGGGEVRGFCGLPGWHALDLLFGGSRQVPSNQDQLLTTASTSRRTVSVTPCVAAVPNDGVVWQWVTMGFWAGPCKQEMSSRQLSRQYKLAWEIAELIARFSVPSAIRAW